MAMGSFDPTRRGDLRKRAESQVQRECLDKPEMRPDEVRELFHELRTHQIELEMQNEELRRIQEELIETRDRYAGLYDLAPVGYITLSYEGVIVESNLTMAHMLCVERASLAGTPLSNFIFADDQDVFYRHCRETYDAKHGCTCQLRMVGKDGDLFWAELESLAVGAADESDEGLRIILSDITERKRSEEALRNSESFLTTLLDAIPIPVFYKDVKGRYLGFNRSFETFYGKSRERLIGKTAFDLGPPELTSVYHTKDMELFETGGKQRYEWQVQDASGQLRDVIFDKAVFSDKEGKTLGLIGAILDVTNIKRAEKERIQLEKRFFQAQKMEAIGTLAGGIAHDFNNILYVMLGNTELAMGEVALLGSARSNLETVLKAGGRAKGLVNKILAFSRKSQVEREPIACVPLLKEMLELLRATIPSSIEINSSFECDLDTVMSNRTEIEQILMNLCTNAAHAMEDDAGEIEVRLENIALMERVEGCYPDLEPGKYVVLSVCDSGCGIPGSDLKRIFDPFFTSKGPGTGTGLGLSVVHGIVQEIGGCVTVESEPGEGSAFRVFIPTVEAPVAGNEESSRQILTGRGTILVVDDEKAIVEMQASVLGSLGYRVVTRTSSLDALHVFEKDPQRYDLVVSDQTMPKMTGDKLVEKLRRIRPDLPVIVCTGYNAKLTKERVKELGIDKILMKPVSKATLAESISSLLAGETVRK